MPEEPTPSEEHPTIDYFDRLERGRQRIEKLANGKIVTSLMEDPEVTAAYENVKAKRDTYDYYHEGVKTFFDDIGTTRQLRHYARDFPSYERYGRDYPAYDKLEKWHHLSDTSHYDDFDEKNANALLIDLGRRRNAAYESFDKSEDKLKEVIGKKLQGIETEHDSEFIHYVYDKKRRDMEFEQTKNVDLEELESIYRYVIDKQAAKEGKAHFTLNEASKDEVRIWENFRAHRADTVDFAIEQIEQDTPIKEDAIELYLKMAEHKQEDHSESQAHARGIIAYIQQKPQLMAHSEISKQLVPSLAVYAADFDKHKEKYFTEAFKDKLEQHNIEGAEILEQQRAKAQMGEIIEKAAEAVKNFGSFFKAQEANEIPGEQTVPTLPQSQNNAEQHRK